MDLRSVLGEVFHNMENRFEHRERNILDLDGPGEAAGVEVMNDDNRFIERRVQVEKEALATGASTGGEFLVALSPVGLATNGGKDPLANVAVEMKNQIADGVRGLRTTVPDLGLP